MLKDKSIIILSGGISNEKDISLKTGEGVYEVLKNANYNVEVYIFDGDLKKLVDYFSSKEAQKIVVFNCLHGKFGEDGRIQGVLDFLKIPYTHSSFLASSIMMNKNITKAIAAYLGINVPKSYLINTDEIKESIYNQDIIFPSIVKPNSDGSSFGLYFVNNIQELKEAISSSSGCILIEEYLKGKEYTVGVLDGKALCVTEIITNNILYDFDAKYSPNKSEHILPAKLSDELTNQLLTISEKLYNFLEASGAIRMEYIINNNIPYLLEANSLPGLTSTSLLPEQAEHLGISFLELCIKLLELAKYSK